MRASTVHMCVRETSRARKTSVLLLKRVNSSLVKPSEVVKESGHKIIVFGGPLFYRVLLPKINIVSFCTDQYI